MKGSTLTLNGDFVWEHYLIQIKEKNEKKNNGEDAVLLNAYFCWHGREFNRESLSFLCKTKLMVVLHKHDIMTWIWCHHSGIDRKLDKRNLGNTY